MVEYPHVVAGHRLGGRTRLDGEPLQAQRVGGDGPPGLGLPPVVDHRHPELVLGPVQGVGVTALSGQEQRLELREVVLADVGTVRVLPLDGAERGGGGEQGGDAVLGDHPPERSRVRGTYRLALVEDGGVAVEQRSVDDVGVADHPSHVGGGPVHLSRLRVVDVAHAPGEGHGVAAVVPHHPLGNAGGAGGVEDVEGIGSGQRHPVGGGGTAHGLLPGQVAARYQGRFMLRTLQDHAPLRLVRRQVDGTVEQRLVVDHPVHLDPARGGHHHLGRGVVDAGGQFLGGEAPEHDRMHGADTGTGEHGDDRFRDHRHVHDHPVAPFHAEAVQRPGELRHPVPQLPVGEGGDRVGHRTVVDECRLVGPPSFDVAVEGVVAGVEGAAGEPSIEGRTGVVQHPFPALVPVDRCGGGAPKRLGVP